MPLGPPIQTELPGTRFFTMLREPVARVVSHYRYCVTPNFWGHEQFAAEFPTITDFIRDPRGQNGMSKYLAQTDELRVFAPK